MANTASYRGAVVALALAVWAMPAGLAAQSPSGGTENGEWPVYHGNLAQHHYSKATGAEVGAVYMPAQQNGRWGAVHRRRHQRGGATRANIERSSCRRSSGVRRASWLQSTWASPAQGTAVPWAV
jgi:hypothetical protein